MRYRALIGLATAIWLLAGCDIRPIEPAAVQQSYRPPASHCQEPLAFLLQAPFGVKLAESATQQLQALVGPLQSDAAVRSWRDVQVAIGARVFTHGASSVDEAYIHAFFLQGLLARLDVSWPDGPQLTLSEAVACFGEPSLYSATILVDTAPQFELQLWYPELGIVVFAQQYFGGGTPPPLPSEQLPITHVVAVPPSAPSEIYGTLRATMASPYPETYVAHLLERLTEWPGGWGSVVVTDCYTQSDVCVDGR